MPAKKEFSRAEETAEYIEFLRRRNRERTKEFYENKIKTNPEKYEVFKNKCKIHSNNLTLKIKFYL